jgi:hypothetical protein
MKLKYIDTKMRRRVYEELYFVTLLLNPWATFIFFRIYRI